MTEGPRPEDLRAIASRYFTVVGLHYDEESVFLPIALRPVDEAFEKAFDDLRRELVPMGFIPMMVKDQGELGIYLARKPRVKYRSSKVNVLLLLITICTTVFAGTVAWAPYEDLDMFSGRSLLFGSLFFALPLMLILGVHELSHYLAARRHGVAASLPFFLPAFPPLGTFGAFISMRDPIPDRKALLDIGVSGPIAGFIMAIAVTFLGVWLTDVFAIPVPAETGGLVFLGTPLIFDAIWLAVGSTGNYLIHPTAFAGWVGFLVTALNLLPAGQLDGGHVSRALFGERSKYAGFAAVGVLGVLSMVSFQVDWSTGAVAVGSGYIGWIVFIFLILFLGLYHPPPLNDLTGLDARRKGLGALAILILVIAFVPVPMAQGTPEYGVDITADRYDDNVLLNGTVNYTLYIANTGNVGSDMRVNATVLDRGGGDEGWQLNLSRTKLFVPAGANRTVNLTVSPPATAIPGARSVAQVQAWPDGHKDKRRSVKMNTTVGHLRLEARPRSEVAVAEPPDFNTRAAFNLSLLNLQRVERAVPFNLSVSGDETWLDGQPRNFSVTLGALQDYTFQLNITPPQNTMPNDVRTFFVSAEESGNSSRVDRVALSVEMPALRILTVRTLPANSTSFVIPKGGAANVTLALDYWGNEDQSYDIRVRASAGLGVSFEPGPLTFHNGSTAVTRLLSLSVAPDSQRGLLSATVSFLFADDDQVRVEMDFTVLVE